MGIGHIMALRPIPLLRTFAGVTVAASGLQVLLDISKRVIDPVDLGGRTETSGIADLTEVTGSAEHVGFHASACRRVGAVPAVVGPRLPNMFGAAAATAVDEGGAVCTPLRSAG